ncbi:antitoxin Xre-like helix-turn-helix domain-containing protein [Exilibacterium tricleocarpae]|uniref:antitoxin Xre-like helix-turn-helix domain-containing protein n=1 Tax=Exilibacterium tricleocarpae TaxID=2591008 RepID=UPI003CCC4F61
MISSAHKAPSPKAIGTGLVVAIRILERWGCTNDQVQSILQMAKSTYHKVKKAPESARCIFRPKSNSYSGAS